jgi:membrane protease YdiL (CAAX protease family)
LQAVILGPIIGLLLAFGEEYGWRGYLQGELVKLGRVKGVLLVGVVWGVWHAPVIAMGHNYGLEYPGFPWAGMLMMVVFTFFIGIFLAWAALRGRSVWPAVIGHASINGIAALGTLLAKGEPSPLLGPMPVGIIGMAGFILVGLWLFFGWQPSRDMWIEPERPADVQEEPQVEIRD